MHQVLIIDDDPDVADAIAEVLDSFGHQSRIARNGVVALDLLGAGMRPCVILCDEMMPAMSGTEFLKQLRQNGDYGQTPVIGLSAARMAAEGRSSLSLLLPKPFAPAQLEEALCSLCKVHR